MSLGGLFGGGKQKTETSGSTTIPQWMSDEGHSLFDRADKISQRAYAPYTGTRTAPLTSSERRGIDLLNSNVGSYTPAFSQASDLYSRAATPIWMAGDDGKSAIDRYMSPYIEGALQPQLKAAKRAYDVGQQGGRASAISRGAFGGARAAIADEARRRNYADTVGGIYGTGYQSAYDRAVSAAQNQQLSDLRSGGAFQDLGTRRFLAGLEDAKGLLTGGAVERGVNQADLNAKYQQFLEGRDWDANQISLPLRVLAGIPHDTFSTSTSTSPGGSSAGQAIGGLGSLASLGMSLFSGGGGLGGSVDPYAFGGTPGSTPSVDAFMPTDI